MCPLRVFFALLQLHLLFVLGLGGSAAGPSSGSTAAGSKRSCPFRHLGAFRGNSHAAAGPAAFVAPTPASLAARAAAATSATASPAARPAPFTLTVPPVRFILYIYVCIHKCGGGRSLNFGVNRSKIDRRLIRTVPISIEIDPP